MEDIFAQVFGTAFGLAVFVTAWIHAGKLPAGPPRATAPAPAPRQSAGQVRPEVKQSPLPTTAEPENIDPLDLDAEEVTTIKRVNEIRDRLEKRRAQLSAMGLEITNLDKW